MGRGIAIDIAGALIALIAMMIIITGHWTIISGNSISATVRLNRTGSIDVCSINPKLVTGTNVEGLQLTCKVVR
jgi:hypothetical protein